MIKGHVWLIAGVAVAAGCADTTGPGITGRWAAPGIELQASAGTVELHLPCVRAFRVRSITPFTGERIEFSGHVVELQYRFDFTFEGQLVGDTLSATLTLRVPDHDPFVSTYQMTPEGDSGLDRQICLA